jgi:hypothetical protein
MEAIEENRIHFHFRVRNLYGYRPTRAQIGGPKNRGHAAAGSDAVYPVVIDLVAGMDGNLVNTRLLETARQARYYGSL